MITEINNQTKLSEHFSLRELTKTRTGIENVPNEAQVENLKRVCQWLEQLRLRYNQMRNEKGEMSNDSTPSSSPSAYKVTIFTSKLSMSIQPTPENIT